MRLRMNHAKRAFLAVLLVVEAAACSVPVKYTTLNSPPKSLQPMSPEKVEVFTTARPTRKYDEVGTMTAMHDSITSNDDMFRAMREEAGKRGCDGLVVMQRGSQAAVATCIVYSE